MTEHPDPAGVIFALPPWRVGSPSVLVVNQYSTRYDNISARGAAPWPRVGPGTGVSTTPTTGQIWPRGVIGGV